MSGGYDPVILGRLLELEAKLRQRDDEVDFLRTAVSQMVRCNKIERVRLIGSAAMASRETRLWLSAALVERLIASKTATRGAKTARRRAFEASVAGR